MKFESDRDNSYLQHYGVPGQKWGVITKEYQPVTFDRRKLKTQMAAQKRAQNAAYQYGRENGQRLGDQFFRAARERHAPKQEQPKKPDLIDRGVKKAADHFGLGAYAEMASNFLKEQGQAKLTDYVMSHKGETIKIGGKYLGKILSKTVGTAGKGVAWLMGNSGKIGKNALKYTAKGTKFMAKWTVKIGKKSFKFLKTHEAGKKIAKGAKWISSNVKSFVKKHKKYKGPRVSATRRVGRVVAMITRKGANKARDGAKLARRGAQALSTILQRRL